MNLAVRIGLENLTEPPQFNPGSDYTYAEVHIRLNHSNLLRLAFQTPITSHYSPITGILIGTHQLTEIAVSARKQTMAHPSNRYTSEAAAANLPATNLENKPALARQIFVELSANPCLPACLPSCFPASLSKHRAKRRRIACISIPKAAKMHGVDPEIVRPRLLRPFDDSAARCGAGAASASVRANAPKARSVSATGHFREHFHNEMRSYGRGW